MGVNLLKNHRVLRFFTKIRHRFIRASVKVEILCPHRLQHQNNHILRPDHSFHRLESRPRRLHSFPKNLKLLLLFSRKIPWNHPLSASRHIHQRTPQQLQMRRKRQTLPPQPRRRFRWTKKPDHDPQPHSTQKQSRESRTLRPQPNQNNKHCWRQNQRKGDRPSQVSHDRRLHRRPTHQADQVKTQRTIQSFENPISHHRINGKKPADRRKNQANRFRPSPMPSNRPKHSLTTQPKRQSKKHVPKRGLNQPKSPVPRLWHPQRKSFRNHQKDRQPKSSPKQGERPPIKPTDGVDRLQIAIRLFHKIHITYVPTPLPVNQTLKPPNLYLLEIGRAVPPAFHPHDPKPPGEPVFPATPSQPVAHFLFNKKPQPPSRVST